MTRKILGPFNRVEGDLTVSIDIQDGVVASAQVSSGLFRGFERILVGRHPLDALAIVPRICGICSVSQSVAAAHALATLYGIHPPPNGERVRNIIHAVENVADHLTHFYLFFMPDFAHPHYSNQAWYPNIHDRFIAIQGSAHREMLAARAMLMRLMGTLAGHWPHSLVIQPGGVSRTVSAAERIRLQHWLAGFRRFLEQKTFGIPLEALAEFATTEALSAYQANHPHADFSQFLQLNPSLKLDQLGICRAALLAAESYPVEGKAWSPAGVWHNERQAWHSAHIREHSHYAWLVDYDAASPHQDHTMPLLDKAHAYSWSKAPRLDGQTAQTGALARGVLRGDPLLAALWQQQGSTVLSRVVARVREIALLTLKMQTWLQELVLDDPFQTPLPTTPVISHSEGFTEAARGMLGHWLGIEQGQIQHYQIIAPTTWNFSPRDHQDQAGPLEQALVGTPATDADSLAIQHIVRSFDPCQVCTVH